MCRIVFVLCICIVVVSNTMSTIKACHYDCYEVFEWANMFLGVGTEYKEPQGEDMWHTLFPPGGVLVPVDEMNEFRPCQSVTGFCNTTWDASLDVEEGQVWDCEEWDDIEQWICELGT